MKDLVNLVPPPTLTFGKQKLRSVIFFFPLQTCNLSLINYLFHYLYLYTFICVLLGEVCLPRNYKGWGQLFLVLFLHYSIKKFWDIRIKKITTTNNVFENCYQEENNSILVTLFIIYFIYIKCISSFFQIFFF